MRPSEIADWEARLQRARRDVFDLDKEKEAQAEIAACKEALYPVWEARAAERKRKADDAFMRLWE